MPPAVALAKEIREAISHRAGITDADLSDVLELEEEEEEEVLCHLDDEPPKSYRFRYTVNIFDRKVETCLIDNQRRHN